MVDLNNELEQTNVLVAATTELPQEYLPDAQPYFAEEQFTEFANGFKAAIENGDDDSTDTIRDNVYDELRKSPGYIIAKPLHKEKLVEVLNDLIEINKKWGLRTGA